MRVLNVFLVVNRLSGFSGFDNWIFGLELGVIGFVGRNDYHVLGPLELLTVPFWLGRLCCKLVPNCTKPPE